MKRSLYQAKETYIKQKRSMQIRSAVQKTKESECDFQSDAHQGCVMKRDTPQAKEMDAKEIHSTHYK